MKIAPHAWTATQTQPATTVASTIFEREIDTQYPSAADTAVVTKMKLASRMSRRGEPVVDEMSFRERGMTIK